MNFNQRSQNYRSAAGGRSDGSGAGFKPDEQRIEKILNGDAVELNEYTKYLAEHEFKDISASQLRNILNAVQKAKTPLDLQFLRYKIAYTVGKQSVKKMKEKYENLWKLMEIAIRRTNDKNLEMFQNFVEAIVAYHKYHGGK